jgi:hypothetical protein
VWENIGLFFWESGPVRIFYVEINGHFIFDLTGFIERITFISRGMGVLYMLRQALCRLAPPCPFHLPLPSYCDVPQARIYYAFTVWIMSLPPCGFSKPPPTVSARRAEVTGAEIVGQFKRSPMGAIPSPPPYPHHTIRSNINI